MVERVPMASADLDESDAQAVADVVRSGRLALGSKTLEFEQAVAAYVGVKHAIAVSSGTAALHLLIKAYGIGPGDEVIVPSYTFAASVNAVLFERATPVFVDIDPRTLCLDPADVARKITSRTKAIMPVDVFGHPVDWDAISRIARERGLKVIDDSCEALGAEHRGTKVGALGDAATFAFYPNKQITTGEGGMIVTQDDRIAEIARSLRNQGRGRMGAWLEHERLGYNYRMDEMSAALGVSQIKRLDSFIAMRAKVARAYGERLKRLAGVSLPVSLDHVKHGWFVYVVTLDAGIPREKVIASLAARGIPSRAYFAPIHQQAYLKDLLPGLDASLPVTEDLGARTLALPFFNRMTDEQVGVVADALKAALAAARKKAA